jgi:hypothetical protein
MNWPVIVKRGPALNQTLSGIKFDKFGNTTAQEIYICDEWVDGFCWAQENHHTCALFVNSGTIILDWPKFQTLINAYPHKGLIAHLIWYPSQLLYFDQQCWFMNIQNFELTNFSETRTKHPAPIRSDQNLHDDYTPLWVKPSPTKEIEYTTTDFSQGLIARQLLNNQPIVNWNNAARDLKFFLYDSPLDLTKFQEYNNIAENQLWVFNNEPIVVVNQSKLVSPGSGLSWILNIVAPATTEIQIVDISHVQIKFCQTVWDNWNGDKYGEFVWNFITSHDLCHYELDNPKLTSLERLKLKGHTKFVEYVNTTFDSIVSKDFKNLWSLAKKTKTVNFCNDNLVNWVINNEINKYDHIWCSNILDYKWTLLHTTVEQYTKFQSKIK